MKIAIHKDRVVYMARLGMHLGVIDGGMQEFRRICPPSVEINSKYVAPIIPVNYSVRIEHWNNLENKALS